MTHPLAIAGSPTDAPLAPPPAPLTTAGDTAAHGAPARLHDAGEWRTVDARVVRVWRIGALLGVAALTVVAVAVLVLARRSMPLAGAAPAVAFLLALAVWRAVAVPARRHAALAYRVDEADVRVRRGIWWRSLTVVPLARLEHVRTSSGPLERAHGLATLTVQTAGTEHAEVEIPGLDAAAADALREWLASRAGRPGARDVG